MIRFSGGKFISVGEKIRLPDDVTMGYIIGRWRQKIINKYITFEICYRWVDWLLVAAHLWLLSTMNLQISWLTRVLFIGFNPPPFSLSRFIFKRKKKMSLVCFSPSFRFLFVNLTTLDFIFIFIFIHWIIIIFYSQLRYYSLPSFFLFTLSLLILIINFTL